MPISLTMPTSLTTSARAAGAAICLTVFTAAAAAATPLTDRFSSFWVLGDSLSDPGNLFAASGAVPGGPFPASPPYFNGRFSNGPVWAEGIADEFLGEGRAAGNFAFGGARAVTDADFIPDLTVQAGLFAAASAGALGGNPLVTLWFGGNDLLAAARDPDLASRNAAAQAAVDAIVQGALAISLLGVDEFLIPNTGDIGATPQFQLFEPDGDPGALAMGATEVTALFNSLLDAAIDNLRLEGLNVTELDVFGMGREIAADPGAFGLVEPVIPCLFPSMDAATAAGQAILCTPAEAEERAFFDGVHPNNVVQGLIEASARAALAPVPLPATLPLLIAAVGAIGFVRRRRAA